FRPSGATLKVRPTFARSARFWIGSFTVSGSQSFLWRLLIWRAFVLGDDEWCADRRHDGEHEG
ncbi:MAG: hypothetical protein WCF18_23260, partial [Chthoniobacteraceae bacterium]